MRLLIGNELYHEVVLDKLLHARESVWIATANVKAMLVNADADSEKFVPIIDVFARLADKGVELRLLHADLPSRPFRQAFDKKKNLVRGGLELKVCPRVHFKCVLIDGGFVYLGSANLTGAGLGAKSEQRRNVCPDPIGQAVAKVRASAQRNQKRRRSIVGKWKQR
ncbi:MAG: hypothetical protein JW841_11035 [Deltaproteobacteria bacterium]|nr:hypothetical protein [Deltaproteobacteria bacterium]